MLDDWETEFPWMILLGTDACGFGLVQCRLCLEHAPFLNPAKMAESGGRGGDHGQRRMAISIKKRVVKSSIMRQLYASTRNPSSTFSTLLFWFEQKGCTLTSTFYTKCSRV
jgi:hypothetical protein